MTNPFNHVDLATELRVILFPMFRWSTRKRYTLGWMLFALAASYGLFVLPFHFPPTQPSISPSWNAGFGNRVSIVATIISSLLVLVGSWLGLIQSGPTGFTGFGDIRSKIPTWIVISVTFVYITVLGVLASMCLVAPRYLNANNQIQIDAAKKVTFFGLFPYKDFDYPYGPILLYPPVLLHLLIGRLGVSLEACYYVTTILASIAGLWLLAWLIDSLVPDRFVKSILFLSIGLFSIPLSLGSHETLVRYVCSFAGILSVSVVSRRARVRWPKRFVIITVVYAAAVSIVEFAISPEMGIVFGCAVACWALLSGLAEHRSLWLVGVAPVIGLLTIVAMSGGKSFDSVQSMSGGAMNWVLVPYSLGVLYLVGIIVLVPLGIGTVLKSGSAERPVLCGLYCCSLPLVVPALSRCDFGHILINGMVLFVLVSAHLSAYSRRLQVSWILTLGLILAMFQGVWLFLERRPLSHTLYDACYELLPPSSIRRLVVFSGQVPGLRQMIRMGIAEHLEPIRTLPSEMRGVKIAAPWALDRVTENTLRESRSAIPERYVSFIQIAIPEQERAKVDELRDKDWLLAPDWALVPMDYSRGVWNMEFIRILFLFPASYRETHPPYPRGEALADYVKANFKEVQRMGSYVLCRRIPNPHIADRVQSDYGLRPGNDVLDTRVFSHLGAPFE